MVHGHHSVAVSPLSRAITIESTSSSSSVGEKGKEGKHDSQSLSSSRIPETPTFPFQPYSGSTTNAYGQLPTPGSLSSLPTFAVPRKSSLSSASPASSSFFARRKKLLVGVVAAMGVCGAIIGAAISLSPQKTNELSPSLPPSSSLSLSFNVPHSSSSGPDLQCIGYSPFHHPLYPADLPAVLDQDFSQIKRHFQCIKTYYSQYFGQNVAEYAQKHGLKVVLGVFYDSEFAQTEIEHAAESCKSHGDTVLGIIVGSEDIAPAGIKGTEDILRVVRELREKGCQRTPIGTSQRLAEYLSPSNPLSTLLEKDELDFYGVTIYPFFSAGTKADNPAEMLELQMGQLWERFPALRSRFHITETGWPTEGSPSFDNQPSTRTAETYFGQFSRLACGGFFGGWTSYFIYHDEKTPQSLDVNQFFGLARADGTLKFSLPVICNKDLSLSSPSLPAAQSSSLPTAEGWTIEADCDYEGNDLIAAAGQGDQCPGLCNGQSGCLSFTWNRYNGGTCWLKTAVGEKKGYPGALCGVKASSSPSSSPSLSSAWSYHEGVDLPGNDIGSVLAPQSSCAALCEKKDGCVAFTWTDYLGGTCFLKATARREEGRSGAFSGKRGGGNAVAANSNPQQPEGWNCESDRDFYGFDIASARGKQSDCFAACESLKDCNGFTWTNWKEGTCWFKKLPESPGSSPYLGGSSCRVLGAGEKRERENMSFPMEQRGWLVETAKDYFAGDLSSACGSPLSCFSGCEALQGCVAFTWTNWNGGTCWFKSRKTEPRGTVGAYSAVMLK